MMEKLPEYCMVQPDSSYGPGQLKLKLCLRTSVSHINLEGNEQAKYPEDTANSEKAMAEYSECSKVKANNIQEESQDQRDLESIKHLGQDISCSETDLQSKEKKLGQPSSTKLQRGRKRKQETVNTCDRQTRKAYTCGECGKSFCSKKAMESHSYVHTGERPFVCSKCGKAFKRAVHLRDHETLHSGEKRFVCSECGKAFTVNSSLKVHMLTHTGEKPHMCSECGRCFTRSSDMLKHLRTHRGIRPFVCSQCGKTFARNQHLESHIDTQHRNVKRHICTVCHKTFYRIQQLEIHLRSHTGERPFVCFVCGKGFPINASLEEHLKMHSNDVNFEEKMPNKMQKRESENGIKEMDAHVNNNNSLPSEIDLFFQTSSNVPSVHTGGASYHGDLDATTQSFVEFEPQTFGSTHFPESDSFETLEELGESFRANFTGDSVNDPIDSIDLTSTGSDNHQLSMVSAEGSAETTLVPGVEETMAGLSKVFCSGYDYFTPTNSGGLAQFSDYIGLGTGMGTLSSTG